MYSRPIQLITEQCCPPGFVLNHIRRIYLLHKCVHE